MRRRKLHEVFWLMLAPRRVGLCSVFPMDACSGWCFFTWLETCISKLCALAQMMNILYIDSRIGAPSVPLAFKQGLGWIHRWSLLPSSSGIKSNGPERLSCSNRSETHFLAHGSTPLHAPSSGQKDISALDPYKYLVDKASRTIICNPEVYHI